jgi:hypothetical protein
LNISAQNVQTLNSFLNLFYCFYAYALYAIFCNIAIVNTFLNPGRNLGWNFQLEILYTKISWVRIVSEKRAIRQNREIHHEKKKFNNKKQCIETIEFFRIMILYNL